MQPASPAGPSRRSTRRRGRPGRGAGRHQARIRKEAEAIAQQQIAPIQQQTEASRSAAFLASAKLTKAPNGQQPDPEVLEAVWGRLDPKLTATKEGAIQAWNVALGYSVAMGKAIVAEKPAAKTELPLSATTPRTRLLCFPLITSGTWVKR